MVTGSHELYDVAFRWKHEYDVIERQRTDEIHQEPSLDIANCDYTRLQNYLVTIFVGDYSYACTHTRHKAYKVIKVTGPRNARYCLLPYERL